MKAVFRYLLGGVSLLLIAAVIVGAVFLKSYTKGGPNAENYSMQSHTGLVVGKDRQHFYQYGFLMKQGTGRCGYVNKYDSKGDRIGHVLFEANSRNHLTEISYLYETDNGLFAILWTMTEESSADRIVKLDKDTLSVIQQNDLDDDSEAMGQCDSTHTNRFRRKPGKLCGGSQPDTS